MGACPIPVSWACRTSLSMPTNPPGSLGMKETKGLVWRARYEDTFGLSAEDNENSFASTATGVVRPGIPNTVTNTNTTFIMIILGSTLSGLS